MRPDMKRTQVPDAELVRAIAQGDEQAFASLYHQYKSTLFGSLLRILNNNAEAEDVLQEVFAHVWQHASDFDETRGRVFTWLVVIAHSRAIDRVRANEARNRRAIRVLREPVTDMADANDDAARAEEREIVLRALGDIPEEQRRVLLLSYFEGLTQLEIAERLKEPLGTIKTRTRTGLRRLGELLRRRLER